MGQLTAEERRRIFLSRQQTDRAMVARLSAPVRVSEPLVRGRRFGRIAEVALTAASLAEILPRL